MAANNFLRSISQGKISYHITKLIYIIRSLSLVKEVGLRPQWSQARLLGQGFAFGEGCHYTAGIRRGSQQDEVEERQMQQAIVAKPFMSGFPSMDPLADAC